MCLITDSNYDVIVVQLWAILCVILDQFHQNPYPICVLKSLYLYKIGRYSNYICVIFIDIFPRLCYVCKKNYRKIIDFFFFLLRYHVTKSDQWQLLYNFWEVNKATCVCWQGCPCLIIVGKSLKLGISNRGHVYCNKISVSIIFLKKRVARGEFERDMHINVNHKTLNAKKMHIS